LPHLSLFPSSADARCLQDEESEEEVKPSKADRIPKVSGNVVGNKVLRAKTRNQGKEVDESKAAVMKQHQAELHAKIQQRGLQKYKHGKEGGSTDQAKVFRKFESYKREDQLPTNVADRRVSSSSRTDP
jgi:nucleosome binding factor SPN SPT16 subunit